MNSIRLVRAGVYMIIHVTSGRLYIGSAVDIERRWKQHRKQLRRDNHHSKYLQRVWNKHGIDAFEFQILEETGADKKTLLKTEQFYLDLYEPEFNSSKIAGSVLGTKQKFRPKSEEHKAKIAAAHRGKKMHPETKQKLLAANLGRGKSKDEREKIRQSRLGKTHSDESRQKMSESAKKRQSKTIGGSTTW